jgi:hypothetical protein
MAQKETDLLRDPLAVAQTRYREQIQAFKDQYIPERKNGVRTALQQQGIGLNEWRDLFKDGQ